jgi:hypothetical protein
MSDTKTTTPAEVHTRIISGNDLRDLFCIGNAWYDFDVIPANPDTDSARKLRIRWVHRLMQPASRECQRREDTP